ncbi:hypothetical protein TNCT_338421 [Trichonephila clavata]|uniref:Uncharacterized protein n=1 Tax=Trichonephila clavata TaxID=2740835 RepID=A0A8X6IS57_TRICU|nr:hypothetical protein TNCT_338421 [Trichonephila clavata]
MSTAELPISSNVPALIYKQGILPFITYGSRIWDPALNKICSKLLQRIQRHALVIVICGYCTISYESVFVISGFPSIDIFILQSITFKDLLCSSSVSNYDL